MTPERARELLPIIQAYAEGKTIQTRAKCFPNGCWHVIQENNAIWADAYDYRIKPEPKVIYVIKEKDMDAKEIAEKIITLDKEGNFSAHPNFIALAKAHLDLLDQNRWISVSERLPENNGCYLVNNPGMGVTGCCRFTNGTFYYYDNAINVTHWKPLPNAPEAV